MNREFLYLDEACVKRFLTPDTVIRTVKELWAEWKSGNLTEGDRCFLPAGKDTGNEFLYIPACLSDRGALGFKWISCYMNPAEGYPFSHSNLIVLNDIRTGELKAVVHGTAITAMRTAGGHAVAAARYLHGDRPLKTLSVIGNGLEAEKGIEGFLCEFPEIEKVQVYCRRAEGFEKLRSAFDPGAPLVYVPDRTQIGKGADVILVATSSPEILLHSGCVEKGTTVIALDGFIDTDPELARRADKWFVGSAKTDRAEIIDSRQMSHDLCLNYEDVYGEITDVVTGKIPGRESEDEIIVYTHMGSGFYDVACAYEVYKKAAEEDCGVRLTL